MHNRKLYLGPLTDSRRWDKIPLRGDDVLVVTPPKCGTTWMQTIVALLLSGDPEVETELTIKNPWIDIRMREIEEVAERVAAMTHRRSLKSHTPLDGIPFHETAQYICVFRHPLDAHFSYRNHVRNMPLNVFDRWYPEDDPDRITFKRFLDGGAEGFDGDAMPLAHILQHYKSALARADRPNVALFHYADMCRDLPGTFERLNTLLQTDHPAHLLEVLTKVATFDHMSSDPARYAPSGGTPFWKSDAAFFHSGTSQKWVGNLTDSELAAYDAMMDTHLAPDERAWLENGRAT